MEFEHDIDDISMKSMHTFHSSLQGVKHLPLVKNVGYSEQLLRLFPDWLVPTDSTRIMFVKKNVKQTLQYILNNQNHFSQNILTNRLNMLSLAEITSSNFKNVCANISELNSDTNKRFDTYVTLLMHTSADSIFYKNYFLYYVNILHHLYYDLVAHNNKIERIKSILHLKCKTFIFGLHLLANNRIQESILHADVFQIYCMVYRCICLRKMCILFCMVLL